MAKPNDLKLMAKHNLVKHNDLKLVVKHNG
jgi:hypothetical protein